MSYRDMIRTATAKMGRVDLNPAHVEAHMRANHGTLDGLSPDRFDRAVRDVIADVDSMSERQNDMLAWSYGLGERRG